MPHFVFIILNYFFRQGPSHSKPHHSQNLALPWWGQRYPADVNRRQFSTEVKKAELHSCVGLLPGSVECMRVKCLTEPGTL